MKIDEAFEFDNDQLHRFCWREFFEKLVFACDSDVVTVTLDVSVSLQTTPFFCDSTSWDWTETNRSSSKSKIEITLVKWMDTWSTEYHSIDWRGYQILEGLRQRDTLHSFRSYSWNTKCVTTETLLNSHKYILIRETSHCLTIIEFEDIEISHAGSQISNDMNCNCTSAWNSIIERRSGCFVLHYRPIIRYFVNF